MGAFAIVNCCPPVAVMVAAEWYLVGSSSHLHDNQWSAIQPNPVLHGIKTAPPPFHFKEMFEEDKINLFPIGSFPQLSLQNC